MRACAQCGEPSDARARFCPACGTPLPEPEQTRESRRRVSVLFCDLAGSTALGERLDPEPLRQIMGRYYETMRGPVERHGGRVEKFIGDAVVAVFGLPVTHEDDALRAVRAATEMRDALDVLNKELERDHGVTLAIRQGINSGEVLWAGAEALGDPVNLAARLEQHAAPGEILIGDGTRRLVRDAVVLERLDPLAVKGKSTAVAAWRLLEIRPDAEAIARRLDSPMVGRDRELSVLRDAFSRAVTERACHLFTVLGTAGVGKSRLVREFEAAVAHDAAVLRGRCLPYGQGITFWPMRDIVATAAGISTGHAPAEAERRIAELVEADRDRDVIARSVAAIAGLAEVSLPAEEIAWAVRRFFESLASRRPLVVVFEDIHWAEPAMLDLIDHVAELSRDAPMLLVCPARPDLLDARPAWGGGKRNATAITLEPLSDDESRDLIANLLGEIPMPAHLADRITEAAGGTPLFVEEMIAMLIDDGLLKRDDGHWVAAEGLDSISVPPTIQALLVARLDRLPQSERAVLERAAVVGREHWRSAVAELLPEQDRDGLAHAFASLVRRDLLRPERSVRGGESYRFRHILILDAAYQSLSKSERADLHERFAEWLGREAPETDDIAAYHVEQAARYAAEVSPASDRTRTLARRAAGKLAEAGRRALHRGDVGAGNLLTRAVHLMDRNEPDRAAVQIDRAIAIAVDRTLAEQTAAFDDAIRVATATGNRAGLVRAELLRAALEMITHPHDTEVRDVERLAQDAIREFEGSGDHAVLAVAWETLAQTMNFVGRYGPAGDATEKAAGHAAAMGDDRTELLLLGHQAWLSILGPAPTPRVDDWLESVKPRLLRSRMGEGVYWRNLAMVRAFQNDFDAARAAADRARAIAHEIGAPFMLERLAFVEGPMELLAGNPAACETKVRPAVDLLERVGDKAYYSTLVTILAEAVYQQGRRDEAIELSDAGKDAGAAEDTATQVGWRAVRAKVLADLGALDDAERLAREGLQIARRTDVPYWQWQMVVALAAVLQRSGRAVEARPLVERSLAMMRDKGSAAHVALIEALIDELEG